MKVVFVSNYILMISENIFLDKIPIQNIYSIRINKVPTELAIFHVWVALRRKSGLWQWNQTVFHCLI